LRENGIEQSSFGGGKDKKVLFKEKREVSPRKGKGGRLCKVVAREGEVVLGERGLSVEQGEGGPSREDVSQAREFPGEKKGGDAEHIGNATRGSLRKKRGGLTRATKRMNR